jgi:ABC-2 type transport system ATP-binding protein
LQINGPALAPPKADMEPQRPTGVATTRLQWRGPETAPVSSQPEPEIVPPIAALRGVGRTFDDVVALTNVDLAIERGSIVGVIGPSGAGKTTAVRLLTGALRPTTGEVEVLGTDPTRLPADMRARVGFMPQHVSLYDDLTVTENLDFVASLYGLFMFRRRKRIQFLLDWLELGEARKRRASALSGGMRRRLQLACALVHDPELVFLDEPTAGIDPLVRQSVWRELHRLREAGRTLVITTQYVPEAEECDTVALIAEGRLIAFAPPEDLRRQAFGGQLLDIETSDPLDLGRLEDDLDVTEVRRLGPRRLQVLSADASTIAPAVIAAAEDQGVTVTSIHEARPSFDEVFALLVRGASAGETSADEPPNGEPADEHVGGTSPVEPVARLEPIEPPETAEGGESIPAGPAAAPVADGQDDRPTPPLQPADSDTEAPEVVATR